MLAWITAVTIAASDPGALRLDKGLDAKLPCGANAALEQAIKVRLPRVRVLKGRAVGADLSAQITATAGGFRFEVRRADGTTAMSRDLFSGCEQLGDTSALILERYLAQISWAGRDVGLVAESPPAPKPVKKADPLPPPPVVEAEPVDAGTPESVDLISRIEVAPEPTGNDVISAEPPPPAIVDAGAPPPVINLPPASPREPIVTALEVSAGGGLWYGDRAMGAFSLDFGVLLRDRVRLGLLALANTPITREVGTRGTVQSFDIGGFAMLGVCTKTALQLCGNAFGGARISWGAGSPDPMRKARLFQTRTAVITVPELGLLGRIAYALGGRFLLAFDLLVGVPLIQGAFAIEGIDEQLKNPVIDAAAVLRLGVRL